MSITRTTISIDSGMLNLAKRLAVQQDCTLGQLITEALQRYITDTASDRKPRQVTLPTSGRGGLRPGINLDSNAEISAILDEEDIARWSSQM